MPCILRMFLVTPTKLEETDRRHGDSEGPKSAGERLAAEAGTLRSERDGYKQAYEQVQAELGALKAQPLIEHNTLVTERDGYKQAYEQVQAELGVALAEQNTLRGDRDGYQKAYTEIQSEIGALRSERDGYKQAYEQAQADLGVALAEQNTLRGDRDGYQKAYTEIQSEIGVLRSERDSYKKAHEQRTLETSDMERSRGVMAEQARKVDRQVRNAGLLREIDSIEKRTSTVFGAQKRGTNPNALILNSVPKAGTYLLLEVAKRFGGFEDCGYHTYTDSLRKLGADGRFEAERQVPALMWAAALKPGMMCVSHTEYDPVVEQYFGSRADLKTIFIIRDPRDLVISWVDFVFESKSYPLMAAWNAYERELAKTHQPNYDDRVSAAIDGLIGSGVANYVPWIDSPTCLTVKFEDLYTALSSAEADATVLDRMADHLELPRRPAADFRAALGKGLTSSGRDDKIGVYRRKMNEQHIARIKKPDFQRIVLDFGYEAT